MPGSPPTLQNGISTAALPTVVGGGVAGSGRFNRFRRALRVLCVIGFVNDNLYGRRDIDAELDADHPNHSDVILKRTPKCNAWISHPNRIESREHTQGIPYRLFHSRFFISAPSKSSTQVYCTSQTYTFSTELG